MSSKTSKRNTSLGRLGSRLLNATLKSGKIAERDLQEKLSSLSFKERKSMRSLCSYSLDVRDDLAQQLKRSPSVSPATSYGDLSQLENEVFLENQSPTDSDDLVTRDGLLSPPQNSYRVTRRRLTAPDVIPLNPQTLATRLHDISASGIRRGSAPNLNTLRLEDSFKQENSRSLSTPPGPRMKINTLLNSGKPTVKQIGRCANSQRPKSASPALGKSLGYDTLAPPPSRGLSIISPGPSQPLSRSLSISPSISPPRSPRTTSPQPSHSTAWRQLSADSALMVNQSSQTKDSKTLGQPIRRSSSARIVRSRSPCGRSSPAVSRERTISQTGCCKLRVRCLERSGSVRCQNSVSPSRRALEIASNDKLWPQIPSHLRRNSAPVKIDVADLSAVSPLRKLLLETSSSKKSCPASPLLARRATDNQEELQLKVKEFLNSLPATK